MSDRGKIQRRFISVLQLDVLVLRKIHGTIFFTHRPSERLIGERGITEHQ